MEKKRSQERSHLTYYLDVVDVWTGKTLGKIADITTEGMMILCSEPIAVGTEKELKIVAKEEELEAIEFKSDCRWCKKDINPDYYDVGFHMDEISDDDTQRIKDLIAESYFDH